MEFTGERFHPECLREIWYEHYHRYVFASGLLQRKTVLDLACGEGYGSALLAATASQVVGADVSAEAIAHAQARYQISNLSFVQASAAAVPVEDARFDAVVSFETIEHLKAQEAMLDEFQRVLNDDGILIISSPDKRTYSDERDYDNPHHVQELYCEEFLALLKSRFGAVRLLGQRLFFHSMIWEQSLQGSIEAKSLARDETVAQDFQAEPLYWIALCGRTQEQLNAVAAPALSLFMDSDESVYEHYYHEIRKNMAAGGVIAERDARIKELEAQLGKARNDKNLPWWRALLPGKRTNDR